MLATSFEPHYHIGVEFNPSFENFHHCQPLDRATEIYLADLFQWANANPNENRHLEIDGLLKAFQENASSYEFHHSMISQLPPLPRSVQTLSIADCPNLTRLGPFDLSNIIELAIARCPALSTLSNSLYNLMKLHLDGCHGLIYLWHAFPKLIELVIDECANLLQLPDFLPDSLIYVAITNSLQINAIPNCLLQRIEHIDLHTDMSYWNNALAFMHDLEQWRCRGKAINENRDLLATCVKRAYITSQSIFVLKGWTISELPPIPARVKQLIIEQCPNIINIPYELIARLELLTDNPILDHDLSLCIQLAMMQEGAAQNPALQQILFEKNLITILQMYSWVINTVVTTSLTLDVANHAPPEVTAPHYKMWEHVNKGRRFYDLESIKLALDNSFGDCDHRACICKSMIDMYLADTLSKLGYHNVSIKANVLGARPPGRHFVVTVECAWNGMSPKMIMVDPWTNAAWQFMTGLNYLRSRKPDLYTHPELVFDIVHNINQHLEHPPNQTALHQNFVRHKMKEQLDEAVQMSAPLFFGVTVAT